MNERIEAYLKQHHCRDYFTSYGETVEDEHYFMYREQVDALIELIVQECAEVIEICSHSNCYSGHEFSFAKESIKKHFGIEE